MIVRSTEITISMNSEIDGDKITVGIDDSGGGEFLVLRNHSTGEDFEFNYEEWPYIKQAVDTLCQTRFPEKSLEKGMGK